MRPGQEKSDSGVLRAAGSVGAAVLLSRILGLVREQVFAVLFGAGNVTDAFNVAVRIPNLLRNLLAEGAMSASLLPTFTATRIRDGDLRAWRFAGLVFRGLAIAAGVVATLGFIFASKLVGIYAPAFAEVAGKTELTVRLTRWIFPYFPLVVIAATFTGVLNACGKFFLPALSSAIFNITSVAGGVIAVELILHGHDFGLGLSPIEGMAMGVLAGGIAQAAFQLPFLYRLGYRFPRGTDFPAWNRDPALRRFGALIIPGIAGLAATQLNVVINTFLATSQGPGAVSWLNYAFRFMQFPIGLFGASLGTATLPVIARMWEQGDVQGFGRTLDQNLRRVLAIHLPAAAGLAFLGEPIISLVFRYGRFQQEDAHATALALAMYSIGLFAYAGIKILVPASYAQGSSRTPVISGAVTVVLTTAVSILLAHFLGFWGLALATSLGATFNFIYLAFAVRSRTRSQGGELDLPALARFGAVMGLASLAMGAAVWGSYHGLEALWPSDAWLARASRLTLTIVEGAFLMWLIAQRLEMPEAELPGDLFRILKKAYVRTRS